MYYYVEKGGYKIMKKMINNKKGFTLIELIVVIAIIGILATVAVPKLGGFTVTAKEKADIANAQLLDQVVQVYYAEKGVFPTGAAAATNPTDAEVTALVDVMKSSDYLPDNAKIKFNDLTNLTFTEVGSTVTAVTYTP